MADTAVLMLSRLPGYAVVSSATFYHAAVGKLVLIGLVVLHISAVMNSRDDVRSRTLALVIFLGCAALVAGMVKLAE